MATTPIQISPDPRRDAFNAVKVVWTWCILLAGVLAGTILTRACDNRIAQSRRQSLAGPEFGQAIPYLRLDHPTLRQAVTILGDLSHARISVDWMALAGNDVPCDTPLELDLQLRDVTLDQALPLVLDCAAHGDAYRRPMGFTPSGDSVLIYTRDKEASNVPVVMRAYDVRRQLLMLQAGGRLADPPVSNLFAPSLPPGATQSTRSDEMDHLIALLVDMAKSSQDFGSAGAIYQADGRLIIFTTPEVHRRVKEVLQALGKD